MIEHTAAEVRQAYRQLAELPDDEMLIHRHGDAAIGAALLVAPGQLEALDEVISGIRQEGKQ